MNSPEMLSRIVQGHHFTTHGIEGVHTLVLSIVTSLAGKREVCQFGLTTTNSWMDVLYGKWIRRKSSLTQTILTTIMGTLSHRALQPCRQT